MSRSPDPSTNPYTNHNEEEGVAEPDRSGNNRGRSLGEHPMSSDDERFLDNLDNLTDRTGRLINNDGHYVDDIGRLIDAEFNFVNEDGEFVDEFGIRLDEDREPIYSDGDNGMLTPL